MAMSCLFWIFEAFNFTTESANHYYSVSTVWVTVSRLRVHWSAFLWSCVTWGQSPRS